MGHKNKTKTSKDWVDGVKVSRLTSNKPSNNTSGHKGIHWHKRRNEWRARIQIKGKRYELGSFKRLQDAIEARELAEQELFKPVIDKYNKKYEKTEDEFEVDKENSRVEIEIKY